METGEQRIAQRGAVRPGVSIHQHVAVGVPGSDAPASHATSCLPASVNGGTPGTPDLSRWAAITGAPLVTSGTATLTGRNGTDAKARGTAWAVSVCVSPGTAVDVRSADPDADLCASSRQATASSPTVASSGHLPVTARRRSGTSGARLSAGRCSGTRTRRPRSAHPRWPEDHLGWFAGGALVARRVVRTPGLSAVRIARIRAPGASEDRAEIVDGQDGATHACAPMVTSSLRPGA